MKPLRLAAATLAFISLSAGSTNSKDLTLDVDCSAGDSLAAALDRPVAFERRIIINVKGTCAENVVIERDDVFLRGADFGAGVAAPDRTRPAILVNGARRASLEGLTLRGGLHGLHLTAGAAATLRSTTVTGAAGDGVRIEASSSAVLEESLIESNAQNGISVRGAVLRLAGSTVRSSGYSGVSAIQGGVVILGAIQDGSACCGNVIENNTNDGVTVANAGGAFLLGNTIRGNGATSSRWGLLVVDGSSARMYAGNVIQQNGAVVNNLPAGGGVLVRGASLRTGPGDTALTPSSNEISGNPTGMLAADNAILDLRGGVAVTGNRFTGIIGQHGTRVRLDGARLAGNGGHGVFLERGSSIEFSGAQTLITGNQAFGLFCFDPESSHFGNVSGVSGNTFGQVSCTGF